MKVDSIIILRESQSVLYVGLREEGEKVGEELVYSKLQADGFLYVSL
jgi:hypothetical protein